MFAPTTRHLECDINTHLMFEPKLSNFNTTDKKEKCPWEKFISIIDESGSTNNTSSRIGSRFRNRRQSIDDDIDEVTQVNDTNEVKTKIIYIAEEEALSHIFVELSNKYDMTGVILVLTSFSTTCDPEVVRVLKSSIELYDMANQIDSLLTKQFGSTDLTLALKTTITDYTKDTLLILASDGRPDNCITVLSTFDECIKNFDKNNKKIDMFCIGAGSIQESVNGSNNYVSRRGNNNLNNTNDMLISRIKSSSGAECDQEFLQSLTEKANTGGYAGAFCDYSQLMIGFNNFLNNLKRWKVGLDTGFADINDIEQEIMNNLELDNNKFAIVFRPNFGHYVICSNGENSYQLAVKKVNDYLSNIDYPINQKYKQCFIENFTPEPTHENDFNEFKKLYINKIYESHKQIVFVCMSNTGEKEYYRPDIINSNQFRIRNLCKLY